jgi:class 3 adenylate cyclase
MTELDQLRRAIAALEALRPTLGESIMDMALAPLRKRSSALERLEGRNGQERRLVSVLFTDVANSTELSQGLEPEEVLDIMDGALQRLAIPVSEYGGRVTRFMGDGFLAIFGLPIARENDALQPVRAGLQILEAGWGYAEELEHRRGIHGFTVRVGISTGLVATGGFSEAEDTVMGLPVNLGARLEQAAPPGGVLISHDTYQRVRGAFEVEALPPIVVEGFSEPVPAYLVRCALPCNSGSGGCNRHGPEALTTGGVTELGRPQGALEPASQETETQNVILPSYAAMSESCLPYESGDAPIAWGPE